MRCLATALALGLALSACSSGDPETGVAAESDAAEVSPQPEPSPEVEPPSPDPEESEEASAYDVEADLATAQALVDAWQEAGLDLGEVRDNTQNQCDPPDEFFYCTTLITTDYVSVRIFVDEERAVDWSGPGRETYVAGRVNLSFGGDSDVWRFDTRPYLDVAAEVLGEEPTPRK